MSHIRLGQDGTVAGFKTVCHKWSGNQKPLGTKSSEIIDCCTYNVWLWEYSLVYIAENAYNHVYDSNLLGCGEGLTTFWRTIHTAICHRGPESSAALLWQPQTLHDVSVAGTAIIYFFFIEDILLFFND